MASLEREDKVWNSFFFSRGSSCSSGGSRKRWDALKSGPGGRNCSDGQRLVRRSRVHRRMTNRMASPLRTPGGSCPIIPVAPPHVMVLWPAAATGHSPNSALFTLLAQRCRPAPLKQQSNSISFNERVDLQRNFSFFKSIDLSSRLKVK